MDPLFEPFDEYELIARKLLTPAGANYLITRAALHSTVLTITNHTIPTKTPDSTETLELPRFLDSFSSLIYLGFSFKPAIDLWASWLSSKDYNPQPFLTFIVTHIKSQPGVRNGSKEIKAWKECMSLIGIGEEMQAEILEPKFEKWRSKQSCKKWVVDFVRGRMAILMQWQEMSRERGVEWKKMRERNAKQLKNEEDEAIREWNKALRYFGVKYKRERDGRIAQYTRVEERESSAERDARREEQAADRIIRRLHERRFDYGHAALYSMYRVGEEEEEGYYYEEEDDNDPDYLRYGLHMF